MITVRHLTKYYNGQPAVKDFSVEYLPGQCSLVIGASGSGKTVLLKSTVGLQDPDEGEVLFDGTVFNRLSPKEKKRYTAAWECSSRAVPSSISPPQWRM